MSEIVKVDNLSFAYNNIPVLSAVSFVINAGDYVALAGPNGAGKTTLIKNLLGLYKNKEAQITLFGEDLKTFKNWSQIGYLPQRVNIFNQLFPASVAEVVGLGLISGKKLPRRFNRNDADKILATLKLLNIEHLKDKAIVNLSGGEQQKVFLARALVSSPQLLIMDEPSTALDPESRNSFFQLIKKLNHEKGLSILMITHDTSQAGLYANKLLYLDKKVIFFGQFADFCQAKEMDQYFGSFAHHLICHQH